SGLTTCSSTAWTTTASTLWSPSGIWWASATNCVSGPRYTSNAIVLMLGSEYSRSTPFPIVPPPTTSTDPVGGSRRERSRSTLRSATVLTGFHSERSRRGRRATDHLGATRGDRFASPAASSRRKMLCSKSTRIGASLSTRNDPGGLNAQAAELQL